MSKIANVTKLLVIKKVSNTWEKDGKTGESHKLVVLQGDNAETLPCAKDVLPLVEDYKEYNFITEFNTDYKTLRIIGVLDNKK